jgi:predicted RecA/RadA family phage recombinase
MPKSRRVSDGLTIDYVPTTDLAAGDVLQIGEIIAITPRPAKANVPAALDVTGLYEIDKDNSNVTAGAILYWDNTNKKATTTATGNKRLGLAAAAAATSATKVLVLLGR